MTASAWIVKPGSRCFSLFSSKGEKGTGLGLIITPKIIHQHGGTIAVRSTPGEATEIWIRIPESD